MPRNRDDVIRDQLTRAKDQVKRIEAQLRAAQRASRLLMLKGYENGLTQSQLANVWGTSQSRMKENLTRAKLERDGLL